MLCVRYPVEIPQLQAGQLYFDQRMDGVIGNLPASSRLSSLTLEASNALLPPLRSHGQQLGRTGEEYC